LRFLKARILSFAYQLDRCQLTKKLFRKNKFNSFFSNNI
jgi:hypothetical protein